MCGAKTSYPNPRVGAFAICTRNSGHSGPHRDGFWCEKPEWPNEQSGMKARGLKAKKAKGKS